MPINVEIKAYVRDFASLKARAEAVSDGPEQVLPQEDTFFNVPRGRLKLRRSLSSDAGQLIYYEREDTLDPKPQYFKKLLGYVTIELNTRKHIQGGQVIVCQL